MMKRAQRRKKNLRKAVSGKGGRLTEIVGRLLKESAQTISIAESCTGGFISSRLTDIPGSSAYFIAALVAYSNAAKIFLLGIPPGIIKKHGAVSKAVVLRMALSIRKLSGTDIGLGITGIAGPGGGNKKKPVGLVHIALDTKDKKNHQSFCFTGERKDIKSQAAAAALAMVKSYLCQNLNAR